jgi:threonine dehydrogenase-like Zn-dependent dehydrogenase
VPLPDAVDDAQAILLSDICPTAWFGARLAEMGDGDTVVDGLADRLDVARSRHAETVDFDIKDPVEAVRELTGGIGVDRVIDALGVDAQRPS